MMSVYQCKKCGQSEYVKAGYVGGEQRYKCKACGCQFVPTRQHGKSLKEKTVALCLYISGLSFRTIGKIVKADPSAVYRWVRDYAKANYEKPEPQSDAVVLELDEMWHFLGSKKVKSGYGRLIVAIPVNLSTGSVEGGIALHLPSCSTGF
jgi:transposase